MTMPVSNQAGASSLRVGQILAGKYRVERVLGSGGMGVVVSAMHTALSKRVALKILRPSQSEKEDDRKEVLARFMREARAAARIQSEHVVRVFDVAALPDGTPYMVMEHLEGCDLRELLLERQQLGIEEATDYVLQACEALAEAHAAGIIHRDLKPSNLFLARRNDGRSVVKVLDFGISKVARGAGDPGITTTNALMGSPLYMAPEQMRSSRDVDPRADVWALGMILYELLAGAPAFTGSTIPEVCIAVMATPPRAMSAWRTDVPAQLQSIILRCLAKDPAERYATVGALARELQRFAHANARVHADRASAVLRVAVQTLTDGIEPPKLAADDAPPPDSLSSFSRGKGKRQRRARRRGAWVAAGAIVVAAAGLLGAAFARRAPKDAPANEAAAAAVPQSPAASPSVAAAAPPAPTSSAVAPAEAPAASSVPNVAIDALPRARAGHATAARPVGASSPKPVAATKPSAASAGAPATTATHAAAPAATSTDDWKWGDRN